MAVGAESRSLCFVVDDIGHSIFLEDKYIYKERDDKTDAIGYS